MSFDMATRRKFNVLGAQAKGSANPLIWDIPKTGILSGVYLTIRGSIAGTLSAPNAAGKSAIIRRIRLVTNGGLDLVNISGPEYFWLLADYIEDYRNVAVHCDGRSAVATGAFTLDVYLPAVLNSRDPLGLFMLQNEQTLVQLQVEFEADATVATGATVTATVAPAVEYYSVPLRVEDWPPFNVVQQILGDERPYAAAGTYDYHLPRGNTYVQVLHAYDPGPAATDEWTRAILIINQSDTIVDYTPALADLEVAKARGRSRALGTIPFDFMGTAGLGNFGSSRDMIYSAAVTEMLTRLTVGSAGTLHTVRRQLVNLGEAR